MLSFLPGTGHFLLRKEPWALGLFSLWLILSIAEAGHPTLRPGGLVMMVQCFAMSDAFIRARDKTHDRLYSLMVNLLTAILLALTEMYLIGGILW